jgi:antitoxin component HigA of HigAB toxin-antitoxin module
MALGNQTDCLARRTKKPRKIMAPLHEPIAAVRIRLNMSGQKYEVKAQFPHPAPRMTPERALQSLMEDNNLSQAALARHLHSQQSLISEFLAGRRGLSKFMVVKLAGYFKVSPELFLPR